MDRSCIFWVGLTRLHLREEVQAGPKAEQVLVEIRAILKAQAALQPTRS